MRLRPSLKFRMTRPGGATVNETTVLYERKTANPRQESHFSALRSRVRSWVVTLGINHS